MDISIRDRMRVFDGDNVRIEATHHADENLEGVRTPDRASTPGAGAGHRLRAVIDDDTVERVSAAKEPPVSMLRAGEVFHVHHEVVSCTNAGGMGALYEVIDHRTHAGAR